ncbi:hypothetical protein LTS08_008349 [Lithohypha guttulata]|nr:hypothetical protein LTS08_008349 [Lithohypha guttulata]
MHHIDAQTSNLQNTRTAVSSIGLLPTCLLLAWLGTIWWGEHAVFSSHVKGCAWSNWEKWKDSSQPHHVLLVADPQLVDPHTYPGRPWPLSTLTIFYTDLYLSRAYNQLLTRLTPDTTFFLGDLFDGGREWGTTGYNSPEDQYKQYGQDFWLKEYERFQNMFVKPWYNLGMPKLPTENGRKLVTSLPGNHDLGFAGGINSKVRSRFEAHFGPTNRIDVRGNHTFVSLDTVSLSAMDQVDIQTGASGLGDKSAVSKNSNIWQPVETYLDNVSELREQAVKQTIRSTGARSSFPELRKEAMRFPPKYPSGVQSLDPRPEDHPRQLSDPLKVTTSQYPTIILSHVPFYRSETSNCGPQRERGTAIPIRAGYQYQNVLTPLVSRDIVDKLDASQITQIYSGDDHDYCEIEHDEFTGRIKEITVKSISWAMGVRKPGVQLVSLWNPIDLAQAMVSSGYGVSDPNKLDKTFSMPRGTVQNHLCLLPDQLAIFETYGFLLVATFVLLIARALFWRPPQKPNHSGDIETNIPLLPRSLSFSNNSTTTTNNIINTKRAASPPPPPPPPQIANNDSISSTFSNYSITSRRGPQLGTYGQIPPHSCSRTPSPSKMAFTAETDPWGMPTNEADRKVYASAYRSSVSGGGGRRSWLLREPRTKLEVLGRSLLVVGSLPIILYMVLLWRDT